VRPLGRWPRSRHTTTCELRLFHLDLGKSIIYREDVTKLLAAKLPNTLTLTGSALIISYFFAIPLGVLAAVKRNTIT